MQTLVVVESVFGNTRRIAEVIAGGLSAWATDVRLVDVADAPAELGDLDLLVVGGPTHVFEMTRPFTRRSAARQAGIAAAAGGLREWLDALPAGTGYAAAFDTRVAPPRTPGASRGAARRLQRRGYQLVLPPETFRVRRGGSAVRRRARACPDMGRGARRAGLPSAAAAAQLSDG